MKTLLLPSLSVLAFSCASPLAPISVHQVEETSALEGVTVDPETGARHVLSQDALIALDDDGTVLRRVSLNDMQPEEDIFHDLVNLGDGSFAMPHSAEVSRLYLDAERVESYFCLLPGEVIPEESPIVVLRENPGIAVDLAADRIYATPRTFEDGQLIANNVVVYTVSEGAFARSFVLPDAEQPAGIAFDVVSERLIGVRDNLVSIYELDAQSGEARIEKQIALEGIEQAVGATLDATRDQLLIIDAAGQLAVFQAALLR